MWFAAKTSLYGFRRGYCNEVPGGPPRTDLYSVCINLTTKCTLSDCESLCRNADDSYPVTACQYAGISHSCIAIHGNVTGTTVSNEDEYECAIIGN